MASDLEPKKTSGTKSLGIKDIRLRAKKDIRLRAKKTSWHHLALNQNMGRRAGAPGQQCAAINDIYHERPCRMATTINVSTSKAFRAKDAKLLSDVKLNCSCS
jgi:hypothetical protein